MRRKLQSFGGCCECTQSQSGPHCNDECDANICSFDPYCCNNQWDCICADAAKKECEGDGVDHYDGDSFDYDYGSGYGDVDYGYSSDSFDYEPESYCSGDCNYYGPSGDYQDSYFSPSDSYDFEDYNGNDEDSYPYYGPPLKADVLY